MLYKILQHPVQVIKEGPFYGPLKLSLLKSWLTLGKYFPFFTDE